MPAMGGALLWFSLQVAMGVAATLGSIKLAAGRGKQLPGLAIGLILVLSARPLESDLQHGNVNILIFFLVMAGLHAFAHERDWWGGLAIALAATFKVTPALFLPYFAYKREWRVIGGAMLGLMLFLFVLPSFVVGPLRNLELLAAWANVYIRPYVMDGAVETLQINQSLPGLFYRLFTKSPGIELGDGTVLSVNWVNLDPNTARRVLSLLLLSAIVWLAWVCRAKIEDRRDWRWACEFGMVFLAMLFISERSWKHHYVTMVLPYSAIVSYWVLRCANKRNWWRLGMILLAALLLMASTSTELGGWLANGNGHKYAQAYGMFFLSGLVIFVALSAILVRQVRSDLRRLPNTSPFHDG
jgi:alpha-1,2-mannosyltransferase